MVIKKCKPTSPGRRHVIKIIKQLFFFKKIKNLIKKLPKSCGRNNQGKITTRHKGSGHKKLYRIIDFKRNFNKYVGIVKSIEYDPYRSSNISLIQYSNGQYKYILSPKGIKINDKICSDDTYAIGSSYFLKDIPIGTCIHNIEFFPGSGGKIARSAGAYCQLLSNDINYSYIRLKSGEIRKILNTCRATIGQVGNSEHNLIHLGKAGASRWRNIRPTVRGTAMNPVDHPHGGGEGKNFGKHPVSPWGKPAKGGKTRNNKSTNKYIVKKRKGK